MSNKIISVKNWKRPYYYQMMLQALMNCDGIEDYEVWNYVDPLGNHPAAFRTLDKSHPINQKLKKPIRTIVHDKPQGCAGNTWYCFAEPFAENSDCDFIIHLEDDTVPSRDYLKFMEWGANTFRDDPNVFVVVGYSRKTESMQRQEIIKNMPYAQIIKSPKTYWGFGWWRHIWKEMEDEWFGIHWKGAEPAVIHEGDRFLEQIKKSKDGSWGWPTKQYWPKGRKELSPIISRIQNIGEREGRFNPNPEWHRKNIWTSVFAENLPAPEKYEIIER